MSSWHAHVEWTCARQLLFEDDDRAAQRKAETKTNGFPAHSFDTLMDDIATLTLNSVSLPGIPERLCRWCRNRDSDLDAVY